MLGINRNPEYVQSQALVCALVTATRRVVQRGVPSFVVKRPRWASGARASYSGRFFLALALARAIARPLRASDAPTGRTARCRCIDPQPSPSTCETSCAKPPGRSNCSPARTMQALLQLAAAIIMLFPLVMILKLGKSYADKSDTELGLTDIKARKCTLGLRV
jgi:hypothetical protein